MSKRIKPGAVTDKEFSEAKQWLHEHFHFILPETPTLDSVLDKAKVLVRRHGLKGLIIDPYNELDHTRRKEGINETEYVSSFLTQLRTFARQQSVHIWLVAHPAKLFKDKDGTYPVPDGYSVSGSAHFYNKADNIVAVHRDVSNPNASTEVHVQKIRSRWLGNRGVANLKWRSDCGRFRDMADSFTAGSWTHDHD
jgi:twinkle protein